MKQTTLHRVTLVLIFALFIQIFAPTSKHASAAPQPALVNGLLFEEDFSDNSAGWTLDGEWQIGPASVSSGLSHFNPDPAFDHSDSQDNGVAGAVIGGNVSTSLHDYYFLTSPEINTSTAVGPLTLEFYRWLNSDYSPYMKNKVEVFNGSTWITLWQSGGPPGIADTIWTQITHDLTPYKNANMRIRFGYAVQSSGVFLVSGWNIDDVRIFVPNSAPIAQDAVLTTAEDTPVNFNLIGTDTDGGSLSYTIVSPPEHGSLSGEAPNLTYQPEADFYGNDSLTYFVNDGLADSAIATLSITVTAVNDVPVAENATFTGEEDTTVDFTLVGSDIDNDPLDYIVVTPPLHGTLTGDGPSLAYLPEADFNGSDSFTFIVNDGLADSEIATVLLTITPVNDAPLAGDFPDILWTARWNYTYLNQTFSDVDGDVLQYTATLEDGSDLPAWLLFDPETVTFSGTPSNEVTGSYAIVVTAEDGHGGSAQVVFTLTVIANPFTTFFPFLGK